MQGGENGGGRAAAFFDLDKTLMEGSSAYAFGRAAHKAGVYGTRDLVGDAWANIKYRLQGASDETSAALRERISAMLEGVRERSQNARSRPS